MVENIFAHAYFNDFGYINGFALFLTLLSVQNSSNNKNIVVHLSSIRHAPLKDFLEVNQEDHRQTLSGVRFLQYLFESKRINFKSDIKQIDFFESQENHPTTLIFNPQGSRIIRVYHEFLSAEAYEALYDAAEFVGVSGDNTLEKSISHQVLPFYHSTNWGMKLHTWAAIKEIIATVDLGFSEEQKKHLIIYFSYAGLTSRTEYWKELLSINLEAVKQAWPIIANYLQENKNFYTLFEQLIALRPPALTTDQQKSALSTHGLFSTSKNDSSHQPDQELLFSKRTVPL